MTVLPMRPFPSSNLFMDGDDYWYPEHLELAADFFNRHPEILAYANRYMRDELEAIPPRPPSYPESIRRLGIRGVLFMNSSNVILNSSLASRLPPWEETMPYGEDGLYWTRCMRGTGSGWEAPSPPFTGRELLPPCMMNIISMSPSTHSLRLC